MMSGMKKTSRKRTPKAVTKADPVTRDELVREFQRDFARTGGLARAAALTPKRRKEISVKAGKALQDSLTVERRREIAALGGKARAANAAARKKAAEKSRK